ncbi:hypothetical protein BOTBODRAFT_299924 [Botryobasidium botryosum FD-172 SS1]|uniref:AB hydrolase-1 domain-containing protein n=1 Tax=Botryobasidium botryosum (strain FD-172 SS1) TaxID=930990 RepID=A0A067MSZ2_BOTB1|nr:hypothetical protein BOTBODRAFT_299924 [Botryobasidium botryosum FD-172 SS1]
MSSIRLQIPHPLEPNCLITGDLEKRAPNELTKGRKLALILHGVFGHRDYLFQKRMAHRLPIDTFRFDFRGNRDTPGTWRIGNFSSDVEDLRAVVAYLTSDLFGYEVDLIVAHSRASIVALRWMCTSEEGRRLRGFVNAAGRYRMERVHDRDNLYAPQFASHGYYTWKATVAGKATSHHIYPEHVDEFASWDTSYLKTQVPPAVHVLTLHGLADKVVPPFDAILIAKAVSGRVPGTHSLKLSENADHNFVGHYDEVVETVLDWWKELEAGSLKDGIWEVGTPRNKL